MPATPSPCADPCAVVDLNDAGASYAAALADALRKKRGTEVPAEIVEAQDSLERRIRAHLAKGRVASRSPTIATR